MYSTAPDDGHLTVAPGSVPVAKVVVWAVAGTAAIAITPSANRRENPRTNWKAFIDIIS
jgi:hypothetical protein